MTHFDRSIAPSSAFPGVRTLRRLALFAALAALAAPGTADAARGKISRAGVYDGL